MALVRKVIRICCIGSCASIVLTDYAVTFLVEGYSRAYFVDDTPVNVRTSVQDQL